MRPCPSRFIAINLGRQGRTLTNETLPAGMRVSKQEVPVSWGHPCLAFTTQLFSGTNYVSFFFGGPTKNGLPKKMGRAPFFFQGH